MAKHACAGGALRDVAPSSPGLQVGQRVSVVCAPDRPGDPAARDGGQHQPPRGGFLGTGPPFTKPGQPLALTNHAVGGAEFALHPPPSSAAGLPGWVLPAAVVLGASDAASSAWDCARQPRPMPDMPDCSGRAHLDRWNCPVLLGMQAWWTRRCRC